MDKHLILTREQILDAVRVELKESYAENPFRIVQRALDRLEAKPSPWITMEAVDRLGVFDAGPLLEEPGPKMEDLGNTVREYVSTYYVRGLKIRIWVEQQRASSEKVIVDEFYSAMTIEQLEKEGYMNVRHIEGRGLCGIMKFMFTHGLVWGLDDFGYRGRWCFGSYAEAMTALSTWSGVGDPAGNWLKYKGEGGERSLIEDLNIL